MRMLFLLNFLTFIVSMTGKAQTTEAKIDLPGACAECGNGASEIPEIARKLQAALSGKFELKDPGLSENSKILIKWLKQKGTSNQYAANCKDFFIGEDDRLGSFSQLTGSLILDNIQKTGDDSQFLKSNPDFDRLCPNFKNFTPSQKVAFHGWIMELTAFPESSCDVKVKANTSAPTTKAVCMYQLEDKPSFRAWRSAGRTPPRCAASAAEIVTVKGCTGCAMDEYYRKMSRDGTPFGIYSPEGKKLSGSYWASHNPLPAIQTKCMETYVEKGPDGKPVFSKNKKTGRPLWLDKCQGANWEWGARYKFFKRIQRFPLCGTASAQDEINGLGK